MDVRCRASARAPPRSSGTASTTCRAVPRRRAGRGEEPRGGGGRRRRRSPRRGGSRRGARRLRRAAASPASAVRCDSDRRTAAGASIALPSGPTAAAWISPSGPTAPSGSRRSKTVPAGRSKARAEGPTRASTGPESARSSTQRVPRSSETSCSDGGGSRGEASRSRSAVPSGGTRDAGRVQVSVARPATRGARAVPRTWPPQEASIATSPTRAAQTVAARVWSVPAAAPAGSRSVTADWPMGIRARNQVGAPREVVRRGVLGAERPVHPVLCTRRVAVGMVFGGAKLGRGGGSVRPRAARRPPGPAAMRAGAERPLPAPGGARARTPPRRRRWSRGRAREEHEVFPGSGSEVPRPDRRRTASRRRTSTRRRVRGAQRPELGRPDPHESRVLPAGAIRRGASRRRRTGRRGGRSGRAPRATVAARWQRRTGPRAARRTRRRRSGGRHVGILRRSGAGAPGARPGDLRRRRIRCRPPGRHRPGTRRAGVKIETRTVLAYLVRGPPSSSSPGGSPSTPTCCPGRTP